MDFGGDLTESSITEYSSYKSSEENSESSYDDITKYNNLVLQILTNNIKNGKLDIH